MAKMTHTALLLLLGASMLMESCLAQVGVDPFNPATDPDAIDLAKKKKGNKVVPCSTFCRGNDAYVHKKKSSGIDFRSNNKPDKCGLWAQSSVVCDCGDCTQYQAFTRTCIRDLLNNKGYCCSCSTVYGNHCACGGTSTKTATFCSADSQDAANKCLSCKTAVCCASGTITRRGPSFIYAGQIDWANVAPVPGLAAWPASVQDCPLGKYSCGGVTCLL